MKRISFLLSLTSVATCAVAQVPSFKQVKNIDLSTTVIAASDYGDLVCDVATDGTNLFVSGLKNSAGTGKSGVMQIATPLGTPAITKLFSTGDVAGLASAGGGRESKIEYMVDGSGNAELFFGYGLAEVHPASSGWKDSGFIRYAFPTAQRDGLWAQLGYAADPSDNTPGYLTPAEANGSTGNRMNGLALDPFTSPPRLAVSAYNRGLLLRFLDGNGANAGNATNTGNFSGARSWRELCFAPNGDMFWRSLNDIFFATRTGGSAFDVQVKIVDNADVDSQMQNIWYMPAGGGIGETLIANDRNDGSTTFVLKVYQKVSGTWTQVATLNGAEPIDGVAQNAFATDVLGFRVATVDGKNYLLVAYGENGVDNRNSVRMYEVFSGSTVSGTVSLGGYAANLSSEVMTAKIKDGAGTLLETISFSPDNAGAFSFTTSAAAPFTVVIKADSSLTRRFDNVSGGSIGNVNLLNGNINVSDIIDISDYTILSTFFSKTSADPDWSTVDPNLGYAPKDADVDGSGFIDIADYIQLSMNFSAVGEE